MFVIYYVQTKTSHEPGHNFCDIFSISKCQFYVLCQF